MTSLATTLTNLIQETSNLLGDSTGGRWAQTVSATPTPLANPIQWFLCEAQDELNRLSGIYRVTSNVTVTAGTATATIVDGDGNPAIGPILRLEDATGNGLVNTTSGTLDVIVGNWKASPTGNPNCWIHGLDGIGTIRLYPAPSASSTFKAYVVTRPVMMSSGSNYPFTNTNTLSADNPSQYHYALPYYAAARCLDWNRDSQDLTTSKIYQERFNTIAQAALAEVQSSMKA